GVINSVGYRGLQTAKIHEKRKWQVWATARLILIIRVFRPVFPGDRADEWQTGGALGTPTRL
ncbi:MAG: hypothetical protein JW883_15760, partial [Deltaproteobacteria bacterium]|nr:hypothetical protein [Deltaproteobacteria bacterium]